MHYFGLMKISEYHLGFIGFGHMAQVICKGLLGAKLIPNSHILFHRRDPKKAMENEREFGITSTSLQNLVQKCQILLIAVRPGQAELVLKELKKLQIDSKMVISVIAGITLSQYQKYLGNNNLILRVMPNVASAVGEGMSVFTFGPNPTVEFRSVATILFSCMGEVIEVPEELTAICTGIAGSGPGFVFKLIDAMAKAGERGGLAYPAALKMAAQTFAGAARLILKGAQPKALVEQIATPNGTTEAGFKVMTQNEIEKLFQSVVEGSAKRSKELSEEFS